MDSLHTRAQNDSPGANASSVKSDDSSPCHDPGRGSPPPNCAICLGTCRNKSFTDSCLHQFCFKCLLTWSKVKAECPLCKQNFRSIIHNVRSNHQYEEYMVEQRHTEEISERIDIDSLHTATRRFRYRTTLTLPRQDSIAIQQLLLHHYPMVAELFPSPPAPRRRSPASFRRTVYRYNLWARPLPDFTRRFRDCTPEFYRHNTSQMHRLVPWLNRELHYLLNENVGHISYVVSRILELLPQHSIISPEFREAMHRYFGNNTDHFLHELYCFASTPYDMNGYDRNVQYTTDNSISTMVNEVLSSSESEASVDSDIVMISSSAPADPPPGPSRAPAPVYPQSYITQPADGVIPIETISQSDSDDDSSEVMVVGYIKPPQDRTPEVVDLLGSDSDVIVQDGAPAERDAPESRLSSLVKLTLTRRGAADSDSDASFYTPSPSPPRAAPPRRRRRRRSDDTATTADTRRTTPSPASSRTTTASDYSFSDYSTDPFSDSSERAKRKKPRRKLTCSERNKSKTRKERPSRAHRKSKKVSSASSGKDKQSKHKSHEGKGVKSSKKYTAADDASTVEPERAHAATERPDINEIVTDWRRAPEQTVSNGSVDDMKRESEQPGTSGIVNDRQRTPEQPVTNESDRAPGQPGTSGVTNDRKRAQEQPGTSGVANERNGAPKQPYTNRVVNDRTGAPEQIGTVVNDKKRKLERSSRRRKVSRESKRLRSVVNVINSPNNAEPRKQSDGGDWREGQEAEREPPARCYSSDSSDDLPLNLSIKKGLRH